MLKSTLFYFQKNIMRFSIKYLPVYAIMVDLLFTVGLNIKEALLPDSKPLPGDGLPIAPEFAFGWIQVAVNGGMTCVLLWAMIMLMRMDRYSAAGERLLMTMPRTLTALVVLAFSLPSAWLWIWSAWVFFNTGQVLVSFHSWHYLLVAACLPYLLWLLLRIWWRQYRLHHRKEEAQFSVQTEPLE